LKPRLLRAQVDHPATDEDEGDIEAEEEQQLPQHKLRILH
jgi:hypothetical protein